MPSLSPAKLSELTKQVQLPAANSHKGQNGKLLLIGGSDLFHAASQWSLEVASHLVDMVFYASVPSNNEIVQQAKKMFWNGLVIARTEIESYVEEADCILIGPGMKRAAFDFELSRLSIPDWAGLQLSDRDWQENTEMIVNHLVARFPYKKWVIDAGALQMIHPQLLNANCIITPHQGELERLEQRASLTELRETSATIVIKGEKDHIFSGSEEFWVSGGHPGMTKGGTGDVLAGLIAGLFATQTAVVAATLGSYVNKLAGEQLAQEAGPFFNTSQLAAAIPKALWQVVS